MAKPRRVKVREYSKPDISWTKENGNPTAIWFLAPGQSLKLPGHPYPFVGPGIVMENESPSNTDWHEYDIDSPYLYAYLGRLLNEGLCVGQVTSPHKETRVPYNRVQ